MGVAMNCCTSCGLKDADDLGMAWGCNWACLGGLEKPLLVHSYQAYVGPFR